MDEQKSIKMGDIAKFTQGLQVSVDEQSEVPKKGYVRFIRILDITQNDTGNRVVAISN